MLRQWTTYLRPWRFEPSVLAIFFALLTTVLVTPPDDASAPDLFGTFLQRLGFVVAIGVVTYAYFFVAERLLMRLGRRTWAFLLLALLFGAYLLALFLLLGVVVYGRSLLPVTGAGGYLFFLRAGGGIILISVLVGSLFNRLDAQRVRAEELRALAEQQRRDLLSADERIRRQVGRILHDQFQSELVTSSLILQGVARDSDHDQQTKILEVISRLNSIHSDELRDVMLALGPNLDHVDLQASLRQLAQQYEPAMTTEVTVADAVDLDRTIASPAILLGLYRVCEQALLNAVKHGGAARTRVSVELDGAHIVLTVSNDGRLLDSEAAEPGLGSSIITAWCSALGGTWELVPGVRSGAVLTARIPAADGAQSPSFVIETPTGE